MIPVLAAVAYALLVACAALAWLFVILYSRVHWYASAEGRHLMKFTVALALTFSLAVLFRVAEPTPLTRACLSVALFGWIAWELANRSRLHLKAKAEVRAEVAAKRSAESMAERDAIRNAARDVLRDEPRDQARDIAHDKAQDGV